MTAREIADIRKQWLSTANKSNMAGHLLAFQYFEPMLSALDRLTAPVTIEEAKELIWHYDTDSSVDPYKAEQHAMQKFLDNRLAEKEKP